MALPNLILGGAPKCGTSSVYRWLRRQPAVAGAARKETFYLMDVGHPLASRRRSFARLGLDGYASLFPSAEKARFRVDATTHTLYQDVAPRALASFPEPPRVAFLLREPAMRAYSSFRFSQETLGVVDPRLDFTAFVELCESRPDRLRDHVRSEASRFVLARDLAYGRYAAYLVRFVEALGRDRVHVLLTEELVRDPVTELRALARFFGIDHVVTSYDLTHENETYAVKHPALHGLANTARTLVGERPLLFGLARTAYWNVQERERIPPMTARDRATVARLAASYAESNAALARTFGVPIDAFARSVASDA